MGSRATKATARPAKVGSRAAKAAARPAKVGSRAAKAPARSVAKVAGRRAATSRTTAKKAVARPTKASPRKAVAKKSAAAKRPTKKAAARPTRRTGRGVPPAQATRAPVAVVDDRPAPNELGPAPAAARQRQPAGTPDVEGFGRLRAGAPANPGVRIAASRSGDVAAAQRQARRPERAARPVEPEPAPAQEIAAPEPGLDVTDSEAAAEARRVERRRARAAARGEGDVATGVPAPLARTSGAGGDDDRVVTIRANRASPPRGDAELVLPADRPPLRPAQPAAQPRKRLFNRTGR